MNIVNKEDFAFFEKSGKIAVVGTVDDVGDPHLTLLTTLMASGEKEMVVGQYAKGSSMVNMRERKKCGFAFMGKDLSFWTGTMDWKYSRTDGEEHTKYNNMPMWRFNTYFGIYEVHYFDLKTLSDKAMLDLPAIGANVPKCMAKKAQLTAEGQETILRPYAVKLFEPVSNPKFLSYINEEGYPVLVPALQTQQVNTNTLILSAEPYGDLMAGMKEGTRVAVMALSTSMESVLVKGTFSGFQDGIGTIKIDRVYNSMSLSRYIYPFDDFTQRRV